MPDAEQPSQFNYEFQEEIQLVTSHFLKADQNVKLNSPRALYIKPCDIDLCSFHKVRTGFTAILGRR